MQRIISAVEEDGANVSWISRTRSHDTFKKQSIITTYFKSGPLFYLEFNYRLYKRLISSDVDVISSVDLDTMLACTLAAKKKSCPLVFDAHEIFYEVPELAGKPFKKSIWKKLAKWAIPKASVCYTVNDSLKEHYQENYSKSFEVVRNVPLLDDTLEVQNNYGSKQLAYLGVLNKGRGIETAITSLKDLPEYKLLLIGDGDITDELKSLAIQHGVSNQIVFTGYKKPDEIFALLSESSIGINLLEAYSENYRLSLANKFFDYMHAGLPSVNMTFPEYEKINGTHEVSVLVENLSVKMFVAAVNQLEDKQLYDRLHENCLKYKSIYSWQVEREKLKVLYNQLTTTI